MRTNTNPEFVGNEGIEDGLGFGLPRRRDSETNYNVGGERERRNKETHQNFLGHGLFHRSRHCCGSEREVVKLLGLGEFYSDSESD